MDPSGLVLAHFLNDAAAIKLLWLTIRDIEDKRTLQRAKDRGKPRTKRTAPSRLIEGSPGPVPGPPARATVRAMGFVGILVLQRRRHAGGHHAATHRRRG